MPSHSIGVIVALPVEAQSLTPQKLFIGQTIPLTPQLVLHITGMGHERAHAGALHLVRCGVRHLISWGTAGGLAPGMPSGKLILPDAVINEQNQIFEVDAAWRNLVFSDLKKTYSVCHEPLLQTRELVISTHEKQRLFDRYKAVALDMESAAIAMAAWRERVKFIAVRSIVDSAQDSFPSWLPHCLSENGEVKHLHLFKKILWPQRLKELFYLFRAFTLAKDSLKNAAALMNFSEEFIPVPKTEQTTVLP